MELTQEIIKSVFNYDNGFLYYRIFPNKNKKVKPGDKAGCISKQKSGDRHVISYKNKLYLSARVIFLWHHGWMPKEVDHINRNSIDNRIENLRSVTRSQNRTNSISRKNSSSQYLGVSWSKYYNKWIAHVTINRKAKHLGYFISEDAAALAYNKFASIHYGEFANLNIIKNAH